MSIFWNIKDNGKDNDNKQCCQIRDETSDNKIKSKEYKKRSESFLKI